MSRIARRLGSTRLKFCAHLVTILPDFLSPPDSLIIAANVVMMKEGSLTPEIQNIQKRFLKYAGDDWERTPRYRPLLKVTVLRGELMLMLVCDNARLQ